MARILYNEGRVVGYSAYEAYVKHSLSVDPTNQPASELEWLSSTIASGSSMLVKIDVDNISGPHIRDINFPATTRLCAANTIIGSYFYGSGVISKNSPWADRVDDYGPLISNTATASPNGTTLPNTTIPYNSSDISNWPSQKHLEVKSYMNICDGLVLQPGTWTDSAKTPPKKDFKPKLKSYPKLRLFLLDKITTPFFLLLTGFTLRSVIQGVCGTDTSTATNSPQDGDFLGPGCYPWANKVVFSIPPSFANLYIKTTFRRKIDSIDTNYKYVNDSPIVDMASSDPSTYYTAHDPDAQIGLDVAAISTYNENGGLLTICQRSDILPPTLYGAKITGSGPAALNPIDVNAPGTLKLFHGDNGELVKESESTYPGVHGFTRDDISYVVSQVDQSGHMVPVSDTYTAPIYGVLSSSQPMVGYFCQQHNAGDPENYLGFGISYSRRISGMFSDKFRRDCGIAYGSILFNAIINLSFSVGQAISRVNTSMCSSMIADPELGKQYYYILQYNRPASSKDKYISMYTLIPVRISNHRLDYVEKMYDASGVSLPWINPPFSTSLNLTNQKYLGTWWNSESIANHPSVSSYLLNKYPNINHIQDSNRSVPLNTSNLSWEQVYQRTKLSDIFSEEDLNGLTVKISDDQTYTYTKIHPDYRNLSLYDLIQTNLVYDVQTKQLRTFTENGTTYYGIKLNKYIAKIDDLEVSPADGISILSSVNFSSSINVGNYTSTARIPIPPEYQNSDGPQAVIQISGNHQTAALSIADSDNNMYELSGESGVISDPKNRTLHWDDLVEALSTNKSIDLIGSELRNLIAQISKQGQGDYAITLSVDSTGNSTAKLTNAPSFNRVNCNFEQNDDGSQDYAVRITENGNIYIANHRSAQDVQDRVAGTSRLELKNDGTVRSAKNYIQLNGLRLYLSTSEPKDSDIPKGSIGFGWS